MGQESTSVGKVFIEYVVINRARNDRVALKGLFWDDAQSRKEKGADAERSYPLTVATEDARYVESFDEEEIRYCLSRPNCFSSVERKINELILRIRRESADGIRQR